MVRSMKALISASMLLPLTLMTQLSAMAADSPGLHITRRTVSDAKQLEPEEMLSDLRDFRLCLAQLKQQSVNLYQEATRTVITPADAPLQETPTKVTAKMIDEHIKYMPPRKEWLVFYVNTLEPIIHLLCEDVQDVDTNGRQCPKEIEEKTNPLWETWRTDVHKINKSLDEIQELIGQESGSNIPLAKAALNIHDRAEELERVRYKVALIFREEYNKAGKGKKTTGKTEKSSSKKKKNVSSAYPACVDGQKKFAKNDFRGQKAPKLVVQKWVQGTAPKTKGKVVILDFWATYCGPCMQPMADLNKFKEKFGDKLVIIGITHEPENTVRDFLKTKQINYNIAIDEEKTMRNQIGMIGVPHVMVISPDNVVRYQGHPNLPEDKLTEEKLDQIISASKIK